LFTLFLNVPQDTENGFTSASKSATDIQGTYGSQLINFRIIVF
jgi:hypothetical protein